MNLPISLALFCRVVDNFGDIGVCWRLARQLHHEHGVAVDLWIDDLASFARICPGIDPAQAQQLCAGVRVLHWQDDNLDAFHLPQVIIEAFACDLPARVLQAMLAAAHPPLWLNLEYLSAEAWVEDCHALPSLHPSGKLRKYFFFPGFSARTGGLLCERGLVAARTAFERDPQARETFLARLGVRLQPGQRLLNLFCYPSAPAAQLFALLDGLDEDWQVLVPEGVAAEAVAAYRGARVHMVPFVPQEAFDQLLWCADFNLVRGEDSFVRAQWAARPFLWHIYPQADAAHLVKLDAFLERYEADADLRAASAFWNGAGGDPAALARCLASAPLRDHARQWAENLAKNGDLASNLVEFIQKMG